MAQSIEGGVTIVNTLTTKNNGDYPLVMAESVQLTEGKTVEQKFSELGDLAGGEAITEDEIDNIFLDNLFIQEDRLWLKRNFQI